MTAPENGPGAPRDHARIARRERTGERLVALLLTGVAALNFPLLAVFRGRRLVAGIPALYLYLFLVWALLAAGTALVLRRRPRDHGGSGGPDPGEP